MSNREPLVMQRSVGDDRELRSEATVLDPARLFRVLRRHWLWLLAPPVLLATLGGLLASRDENRYEATAMVALQQTAAEERLEGDRSNALAERQLQTEDRLLNGPAFAELVEELLGGDVNFEARAVEGTDLIEVTAEAAGPDLAASAAVSIAELYLERRRIRIEADIEAAITGLEASIVDVEERLAEVDREVARSESRTTGLLPDESDTADPVAPALRREQDRLEGDLATLEASLEQLQFETLLADGGGRIAATAVPPDDRVSPNPTRSAILWAMLGVLIGLGLVWVRELLDRRIRSADDLTLVSGGLDFVGHILKPDTGSLIGPASLLIEEVADRLRVLASSTIDADDEPFTIQVTGVHGGEGSTFVAANLAAILATGGWAAALVDADFARGDLHDIFGVQVQPGTKQLLGGEPLRTVVQASRLVTGLGVVARGSTTPSDATLHNSTLSEMLRSLSDRFDVVIVDSPPILESGDAAVLASHVDKTILVAAVNDTTQPDLESAVRSVVGSGGRVSAIALTQPARALVGGAPRRSIALRPTASDPAPHAGSMDAIASVTGSHLRPRRLRRDRQIGPPS